MHWIHRPALLLLALLLGQGCGYTYKTLGQEAPLLTVKNRGRITGAAEIFVRPISFSRVPMPEDYESQAQWRKETRDLTPEYNEEVTRLARDVGLADRVNLIKPREPCQSGLLVEAEVTEIRRNWNFFSGGFDFLVVELRLSDGASGEVLYKATVEVSSKRFGPVGWRAQSFPGRLALASWNVVGPIFSVLKKGRIEPEME